MGNYREESLPEIVKMQPLTKHHRQQLKIKNSKHQSGAEPLHVALRPAKRASSCQLKDIYVKREIPKIQIISDTGGLFCSIHQKR